MGHLNLLIGWLWILAGFISGLLLGSSFQKEDWMGGYASWKRRLFRLAHISFFGLAIVNLLFFFTVRLAGIAGLAVQIASCGFAAGAVSMPISCVIVAHRPGLRILLFSVPVTSLFLAGALTVWEVAK